MNEEQRILQLERENRKLKEDNEYLYVSLIQMHHTIDRLLNHFIGVGQQKTKNMP